MRVVEISDPSSFHTNQWITQLLSRNIETHAVYIEGWFDNEKDKISSIENLHYKLFFPPDNKTAVSSLLRKGKLGTVLRSVLNNTMLYGELEILGPQIGNYLKDHSIDVVHAHYVHGGGFIAYASRYEPCILSTWGSDLTDGPEAYPYYIPLMRKTLDWSTIINPASEVSATLVKTFATVDENRIFVSSWGADTDFFNPNLNVNDLKEELSLTDGPIIISFRSLEPYYRIDVIIRAFKKVLEKHPGAHLIIGNDGPLREELEVLTKQLGIEERVIFTGYVVGERMAKIFALGDIYIQCPLSDGVSVSGMQALASGLAMVGNDVGETKALIRNGFNGYLIDETDDPNQYAMVLIELLDDNSLLSGMKKNSRIFSEEHHDRYKFLDKFEKILKGLSEGARTLDEIF